MNRDVRLYLEGLFVIQQTTPSRCNTVREGQLIVQSLAAVSRAAGASLKMSLDVRPYPEHLFAMMTSTRCP